MFQGPVPESVLYALYARGLPVTQNVKLPTDADEIAALAVGNTIEKTSAKKQ